MKLGSYLCSITYTTKASYLMLKWINLYIYIFTHLEFNASQASMGSPLCEQMCEQIVQKFKNNISLCTIARDLGFLHLQSVTSKESKNLDKSLQVSQKAENHH